MSCKFCEYHYGLKWLCACQRRTRVVVEHAEEYLARRAQDDPELWYQLEVERMKDRAPA